MVKVLIAGSVKSQFNQLFEKVAQLNKTNKFDFIILVGKTFQEDMPIYDFINQNDKQIEVPTYLIDYSDISNCLSEMFPDGHQICHNLYFLGRSGIKTIQGITVGFMNGIQYNNTVIYDAANSRKLQFSGQYYTSQDIDRLIDKYEIVTQEQDVKGIDILITNEWPASVINQQEKQKLQIDDKQYMFSKQLDRLMQNVATRYHFVGIEDIFYQRQPYQSRQGYLSRFISVSGYPSASQKNVAKYLYAFQIQSMNTMKAEDLKLNYEQADRNPFAN